MTDHPAPQAHGTPHETNEDILARVLEEQAAIYPEMPCAAADRPCVRRAFPGRLRHWIIGASALGALVGFVVPLALGVGAGYSALWALAGAVAIGCTVPLLIAEAEDGWRNRARVPANQAGRKR